MSTSKTILLSAVLGMALLITNIAPSWATSKNEDSVSRCGGKTIAEGILQGQTLPTDYMIANGRIFSLAELFECTKQLHTTRRS